MSHEWKKHVGTIRSNQKATTTGLWAGTEGLQVQSLTRATEQGTEPFTAASPHDFLFGGSDSGYCLLLLLPAVSSASGAQVVSVSSVTPLTRVTQVVLTRISCQVSRVL